MIRKLAAGVLSGAAEGLHVASKIAGTAAQMLKPPPPRPERGRPGVGSPGVSELVERGRVTQPPTDPRPVAVAHERRPATHVEELAERNASVVVAAIGDLSTDELRRLYEYESAHRKRKTVLEAIERQSAPVS